jgi:hypothetical protein
MEINREEVKEEVLKIGKWTRFVFMFFYAFVLNFVISVTIGLAFIQFLFFLFTSKINDSLAGFNQHLFLFVSDTLKFLLFETDEKPFPFKKSAEVDAELDEEVFEEVNVVEEVDVTQEKPNENVETAEVIEEDDLEHNSKS